ncbi:C-C chemokine receptor type 3 [Electrophorus electricus]|uniref:C-C chemokine receptor type 3 n=1 Tax=Electrophorus electricus TaxID=8005 RepID=UPI0015D00680|nr:C-C chemokine receptor type 3 [Electrophorus electricus]
MAKYKSDTSTQVYEFDNETSMTYTPPCNTDDINNFGKNFLPLFYSAIFTISILGNGLVLYILYKFENLRAITNIFLINLVASNLIVIFSLPFQAVYHYHEWIFGSVACKMVGGAYFLGIYSSVLFLTLITLDRYQAVVHAVAATKRRHSCYAFTMSAIVWSVCGIASLEAFFSHDTEDDLFLGITCGKTSDSKVLGTYPQFVIFFIFPLAVTLYCYIRIGVVVILSRMKGKHRTVKIIFVIVVLFFMCWTPYNVVLIMKEHNSGDNCDDSLIYVQYITHNIAHLYFCVNPVFYTFVGRKFQTHVRRLLVNQVPCLTSHMTVTTNSRSFS